jgi:hypothetical protein
MANSLDEDWWQEMVEALEAQGVVLDPQAEIYVKKILAAGAHLATRSPDEPNGSWKQLMDAILRAGLDHPHLSENNVGDAMKGICPIWPFC